MNQKDSKTTKPQELSPSVESWGFSEMSDKFPKIEGKSVFSHMFTEENTNKRISTEQIKHSADRSFCAINILNCHHYALFFLISSNYAHLNTANVVSKKCNLVLSLTMNTKNTAFQIMSLKRNCNKSAITRSCFPTLIELFLLRAENVEEINLKLHVTVIAWVHIKISG